MAGLSVIIRKEVSDAMSNRTFLLAVFVLVASMILTGAASGDSYYKQRDWRANMNPQWGEILIIFNVLSPIRFLGAIVAIAFSFNSINKERTEGSLKTLLSYPIYRDQVILGKLAAGLLLISFVSVISMSLALTVYVFVTSITLTFDLLARFGVVTLLAMLLLGGYLGLGMALSIVFKDPKTTLVVVFLFLGLFHSVSFVSTGNILTNLVFGHETYYYGSLPWQFADFNNPLARMFQVFVSDLNPSWGFSSISSDLGYATKPALINGVNVALGTDIWVILSEHLNSVAILVVFPVITYILSYVEFNKSDVT
jgi:ABC-2 type transport system permease protein